MRRWSKVEDEDGYALAKNSRLIDGVRELTFPTSH